VNRVQARDGSGHAHQIKSILCLIDFSPNRPLLAKPNGLFVPVSVSFGAHDAAKSLRNS
jgi:hypothetical protein